MTAEPEGRRSAVRRPLPTVRVILQMRPFTSVNWSMSGLLLEGVDRARAARILSGPERLSARIVIPGGQVQDGVDVLVSVVRYEAYTRQLALHFHAVERRVLDYLAGGIDSAPA